MKRRIDWSSRRGVAVLALFAALLLEALYGCAGEKGVTAFVEENVGEVSEALITCDYILCSTPPDVCHTVAVTCDGTGHCLYPAGNNGTSCSDGNACTSNDVCSSGVCSGTAYTCTPGVCKATSTCDGTGSCTTTNQADGTSCGSGQVCSSGSCITSCYISGAFYASGAVNPGNACQVCTPASSTSAWSNKTNGTTCSDGNACTSGDTCQNGTCTGGTAVVCTALDQCHDVGTCNTTTGVCSNPNKTNGTACSDGNACTTGDTCQSGTCTGGAAVVCTALDQCHDVGTCNTTTGVCSNPNKTNGTACSDGNACTTSDTCQSGTCTGGAAVTCSALDSCHVAGTCNTTTGVCSNPNATDGTNCGSGKVCGAGSCLSDCFISGTLYTSGAANPVNVCQVCAPASTTTAWSNAANGTACGTGTVCATGSCVSNCFIGGTLYAAGTVNPNNACQVCTPGSSTTLWSNKADGAICNDGNACTQSDTCQTGVCTGGSPIVCAPLDQCHVAGTCNTATGICSNPNKTDGTACDDGNPATTGDTCQAGLCGGVNLCAGVTCNALDPCHAVGTCAPATGMCSNPNKPDGTACNDNNPATTNDVCLAGVCGGANLCAGKVCTALDPCHDVGTCDPSTGVCSNPNKTNGTACNDNNPCTTADTCQAGVCNGGPPVTCAALDQCHVAGSCDQSTGLCSNPHKSDGAACDDGDPTTTGDTCANGLCGGIDKCIGVTCTALDACHAAGTCAPATGKCSDPNAADNTPCDDGNPNTANDVCSAGVCAGIDPCATVTCAALDQCHDAGTCDHATGKCSNPNKADGATCDDGDPGTTGDVCTAGLCGPPNLCTGKVCTAADACHDKGTCDPASGDCSNPVKSDGTACPGGKCQGGACVPETDGGDLCSGVTCKAADSCHEAGACDPSTGKCSSPVKPDGTVCDEEGTCKSGKCSNPVNSNYYACAAIPGMGSASLPALFGGLLFLSGLLARRRRR